jgi:hypothetical protein
MDFYGVLEGLSLASLGPNVAAEFTSAWGAMLTTQQTIMPTASKAVEVANLVVTGPPHEGPPPILGQK